MNTIETAATEEDLFKLSAAVGRGQENNPLDVAKVESLMGATGHLDIEKTDGPTGYFGQRLEGAVKEFQNEEKLKADGLIKPEGETIVQTQKVSENEESKENKKDKNEKPIKENALISLFRWISEKMHSPEEPYDGPYVSGPRGQK